MITNHERGTVMSDKAACSECDAWAVLLDGGLCPECLAEREREAQWDELLAVAITAEAR
jgi:predicted amidophosphoribosyltransferase